LATLFLTFFVDNSEFDQYNRAYPAGNTPYTTPLAYITCCKQGYPSIPVGGFFVFYARLHNLLQT